MTPLEIGKDGFSLPIELVTSTQAILASKRSGKSYTASVQAEELLQHKQQMTAIDPTCACCDRSCKGTSDATRWDFRVGIGEEDVTASVYRHALGIAVATHSPHTACVVGAGDATSCNLLQCRVGKIGNEDVPFSVYRQA